MNSKENFGIWLVVALCIGFYTMGTGAFVSPLMASRVVGGAAFRDKIVLFMLSQGTMVLAILVLVSYFLPQFTAQADARGIHWRSILGRRSISWARVTSLTLETSLRGEKELRIVTPNANFKVELRWFQHPDQFVHYCEDESGHKVT